MKRAIAVLGLALTTACASPPPPAAPIRPAPVYTPPPAYVPPPPPPPRDQCGAAALQNLVGQPRTAIPVPVNPALRRVTCTTCPMTMDFNPARLNILYDEESGTVREVKCG